MGKLLNMLKTAAVPAQRTAPAPAWRAAPGREVPITILGEASYQPYIAQLARKYKGDFQIVLRAEANNPYDRNAVAILVDGGVVGYLPRELAPRWQPTVQAAASEGYLITGTAAICGGTRDKPTRGVFGGAVWPAGGKPPRA
jgi:hypothetical protein